MVFCAGEAAAQTARSFSPQLFHAAPGPDEFISIEPAAPLGHKGFGFGALFNYGRNTLSILDYNAVTGRTTGARADLIGHALAADVWGAFGLWDRAQVAVLIPMTLHQTGNDFDDTNPVPNGTHFAAPRGFAMGDPRLYLKARLVGKDRGFQIALSHWLSFPFGNDANFGGEKHFSGFSGEPTLLGGYEGARFRIGVSFGFLWRAHSSQLFSTRVSHQLTYGAAAAIDVLPDRLTMIGEINGRNSLSSGFNDNPLEIDVAAKVTVYPGLRLTAGLGNGLVAGIGSPQPRVFVSLAYVPDRRDRDKDGIPDVSDKCPDDPEDKDGFQDQDGCPDPDNDLDGIPDAQDKCPNQAEDFDHFEDEDGCPDSDNDKDGIDDLHDACPNVPEDHKPPLPNDGCPAVRPDSDGDGIPDDVDKCPKELEDNDGFEDQDGCPDYDNDQDGIPDEYDKCPNDPETFNGFQDEDGCPDQAPLEKPKAKLEKGRIIIFEKVYFDTNRSTIQARSFKLLDEVAAIIRAHPKLRVRVEGHTDSQGKPAANLKLSQARANSVRTFLVDGGVEPARVEAVGCGQTQPIADNKTRAGREDNRRVEFHILDGSN